MFEREIELLETLQIEIEIENNDLKEDIDNMIFNLENFNIFDYINKLDNNDIIEIMITLSERLENEERRKAKKLIEQDNGFYNSELKKCENNIDIFKKIYDLLCNETY